MANGALREAPLTQHNCHFSQNTIEAMRLHSALNNSGGVSALVRTVMEYYLATGIDWKDPRYSGVDPVTIPREVYPGQHRRLGLVDE